MLVRLKVMLLAMFFVASPAWAGACGSQTSVTVAAIPFDFYITKNKGRWVTLSATSNDIEWQSLNQGWPTRYKAFKYGGGAAITEWKLDSLPAHGKLYEGTTELSVGATITDPDDLYYTPNIGFTGEDPFGYCVTDSSGRSGVATVTMHVESAESYPMPLGIPDPNFGINEEPPADPSGWPGSEVAGYYYIDSDHPSCTNSNDYGWPNRPRCNIGTNSTIGAGRKMVLAPSTQPYALRSGNSWDRLYFNGTANNPAWLVGDDRSPDKPRITIGAGLTRQEFRIEGTGNYRISGVDIDGPGWGNRGEANNVVIRYSRVRNNPSTAGGGTTVGLASGSGVAENVLAFHVNAHDNGVVSATLAEERDIHAFVGVNQKNFWMIDIMCSENAGDCVQLTNNNTTENVYVGRATMHSMMENCTDYKDFRNFVVSQSDCWDIRPVGYASGSGGGAQNFYVNDEGDQQGYGYFLNNRSWDTSGENFGSANIGGRVYFIGNRAFFSPEGAGMASSNGGGERHYYFNTAVNVKDGLFLYTAGDPVRYIAGNYIGQISRYGAFAAAAYSNIDGQNYNVYDANATFAWGSNSNPTTGSHSQYKEATGYDANSTENGSPDFVSPSTFDFRLRSSSPLIDVVPRAQINSIAPGLADMQSDLGISFVDYNGSARLDSFYDVGADESDNLTPLSPPLPPPNVTIQ